MKTFRSFFFFNSASKAPIVSVSAAVTWDLCVVAASTSSIASSENLWWSQKDLYSLALCCACNGAGWELDWLLRRDVSLLLDPCSIALLLKMCRIWLLLKVACMIHPAKPLKEVRKDIEVDSWTVQSVLPLSVEVFL